MGIEKERETAIKELFFALGGWVTKVQSGMIMQTYKGKKRWIHLATKGTPDLLGCLNGHFVAIEVKKNETEKKRWHAYPMGLRGSPVKHDPRVEAQKAMADKIKKSGGIFILACDLDDVERQLIEAGAMQQKRRLF